MTLILHIYILYEFRYYKVSINYKKFIIVGPKWDLSHEFGDMGEKIIYSIIMINKILHIIKNIKQLQWA